MKKKQIFTLVLWMIFLICIAFIWINSMQTKENSNAMSNPISEKIKFIFEKIFNVKTDLDFGFLIRKAAHFTEYAILSLLLCFSINLTFCPKHSEKAVFFTLPISFIIASVDETIQLFSSGRTGSFYDVLLDFSAALCSTLAFFAVLYLKNKNRKANNS